MKLRVKGDSLRLRIGPSEVTRLVEDGRVAGTVHFGPGAEAKLTYALESSPAAEQSESLTVRYAAQEVAVVVPASLVKHWADSSEVGLYGSVPVASGVLEVVVEKDFACLDRNDAENEDTFPHPKLGAVC